MALIYLFMTIVGAQSRGALEAAENGGVAFAQIAQHYLGRAGLLILAVTVTLACLKTAVGLIASCAETFSALFPKGPGYRVWAVIFSLISLLFANFGLSSIISYSLPVLMLLYPLAITLILLSLCGRLFGYDRTVFVWTTALTLLAALYDFLTALPERVFLLLHGDIVREFVAGFLPFASLGLGWVCPALLGFAIGLAIHLARGRKTA